MHAHTCTHTLLDLDKRPPKGDVLLPLWQTESINHHYLLDLVHLCLAISWDLQNNCWHWEKDTGAFTLLTVRHDLTLLQLCLTLFCGCLSCTKIYQPASEMFSNPAWPYPTTEALPHVVVNIGATIHIVNAWGRLILATCPTFYKKSYPLKLPANQPYSSLLHYWYGEKSALLKRYLVKFLNNNGEMFVKSVPPSASQAKFPQHITDTQYLPQLGRPCTLYSMRA